MARTPKLRFAIAISLDGFVARPEQRVRNPIGVGGMRLHPWVFPRSRASAPR